MKDFYSLFIKELKDIYDAELHLSKALPEMIKTAHSQDLKDAFQRLLLETKAQLKRLDEIGSELSEELSGGHNEGIKGLIKEGQKLIKAGYHPAVKDAALITEMQFIVHYQIAAYGSLKAYAKHLDLTKVHRLLDESSKEEGNVNKTLNLLAEGNMFRSGINDKACRKTA